MDKEKEPINYVKLIKEFNKKHASAYKTEKKK
jgi:hypothetical protein